MSKSTHSNPHQKVSGLNPGRSVFDLSYEKKLTCDMGQLIPIMCDEMVPGDKFTISNEIVMRMQPLVAPIMHEVNVYVHYWFVPYRIMWDEWEEFITGGIDGEFETDPPIWDPTDGNYDLHSLWDYFGFPINIIPNGAFPSDFPRRAYNFIYNEFFRDETLITEVELDQDKILNRCWEKDYFTSSLPFQQRGQSPSVPLSGTANAEFFIGTAENPTDTNMYHGDDELLSAAIAATVLTNSNTVDLTAVETFSISDLRLAFQIQKFLERNARAGARYVEFVKAHFGNTGLRDDRLQRPEYIGGSKSRTIISEVLQTSQTDELPGSPQGNLAGHGIVADRTFAANFKAPESGLVIGIMSVMPRSAYQQGIDRQWLRRTKYDYFFPEFANLSEQGIEKAEIFTSEVEMENKALFGYTGRYDEMRIKRNMVVSDMRDTFDYWHLGRKFEESPELNAEFVTVDPEQTKRIFAVQDEPGPIINIRNKIKAVRPIPIASNPGLIDHN